MPDDLAESLISTPSQLRSLVEHIRECGRFGFDTEFVSEETFEPVLCLIQVATKDQLAVVDPFAVKDLDPFWEVVLDPSIEVVMHAAGEDLRICQLRTGQLPRRVFDVQIAAGLIGLSYPLSLVNLVSQVLRIGLPGSETRTDWRRRPLTSAQLRYALDDVRYLLSLADHIASELNRRGRESWAEEEFTDFIDVIEKRSDEDRWRRLPGLHQLNRRGLEAARRLSNWRIGEARRANRPVRQILRDDLLVAIARRQPLTRRDLEALRDFNRPGLLSLGPEILAEIEAAREVPEDQLPEPFYRPDEGPGLSTLSNLLSSALALCCVRHEISAGLLANVSDVKHLIRWFVDGRDDRRAPSLLQGWRGEVCGRMLLDVLEGRLAVRVRDPDSEFPIELFSTDAREAE
jgi:ribonuclease D